jgi:hypothetical protein
LFRLASALLLPLAITLAGAAGNFQVPEQSIVGADEPVPLGELVDLTVSPIKEKPQHLDQVSYQWTVLESDGKGGLREKRAKNYEDGVFFGAGLRPQKVFVVCHVTYLFVVRGDDKKVNQVAVKTVKLSSTVTIGEPGPDPPGPGPGPNPPGPEPVVPDGQFKLAKFVYGEANKVAAQSRSGGAKALAEAFRSMAASVAAGAFSKDEDILKESRRKNNSALAAVGDHAVKDWDGFFLALQDRLYELYKSGALKGKDAYATAFREMQSGVEAVR